MMFLRHNLFLPYAAISKLFTMYNVNTMDITRLYIIFSYCTKYSVFNSFYTLHLVNKCYYNTDASKKEDVNINLHPPFFMYTSIHFLFEFYRIFLSIIGLPYGSPAMT